MSGREKGKLETIAFIGLGRMGMPMARRLSEAGFSVQAFDLSSEVLAGCADIGVRACMSADDAAENSQLVITMLPDGDVVRQAVLGPEGAAKTMNRHAVLTDMSSSAPLNTRKLGIDLAALGLRMIDAPVSGGIAKAGDGSLTIIAGGEATDIVFARPALEAMGSQIIHAGPLGSGHAAKALNNYVSAAGLSAACEALLIAEAFGIDRELMVDVLNGSTGRNNSTQMKLKPHILSSAFASGFAMDLMAKDLRTAAGLAKDMQRQGSIAQHEATLWSAALALLGNKADHTEIYRYLEAQPGR